MSVLNVCATPVPQYTAPWTFDAVVAAHTTRANTIYTDNGMPLIGLANSGKLVELAVRRFFQIKLGRVVKNAPITSKVDDSRRGIHSTECDFVVEEGGEDVEYEVKSATLSWQKPDGTDYYGHWHVNFTCVKFSQHDRLVLVIIDVDKVYVYLRNQGVCAGNSTQGVSTDANGCNIRVRASSFLPDFVDAVGHIRERMSSEQGTLLGEIAFNDPAYEDIFETRTEGDVAYEGIPTNDLCIPRRGCVFEDVVRLVYARCLTHDAMIVDAAVTSRCESRFYPATLTTTGFY